MQLLTAQQAAEKLGVHVRTIHRWEREGVLRPTFRTPGGHRRYSVDDINRAKRGAKND